jgi:hypothetical protein
MSTLRARYRRLMGITPSVLAKTNIICIFIFREPGARRAIPALSGGENDCIWWPQITLPQAVGVWRHFAYSPCIY